MAVTPHALIETRQAFDAVADSYHEATGANPLLNAMRARARREVLALARPGSRILELGCGPGLDAVFFAEQGYDVTAIDWSAAMVAEASRHIVDAGVGGKACARVLGIHELDALESEAFDAVYSSLGPLNCVLDLHEAARLIFKRLRAGGVVVVSVMGRWCPWELAVLSARGQGKRARQRFARGVTKVSFGERTVWVSYYTPREIAAPFVSAGFRVHSFRALGLLSPPPYLKGVAERWPRLVRALLALDDRVGGWPGLRSLGDHFLMTVVKP